MPYNLGLLTDKITTLKSNADELTIAINYRIDELGGVTGPSSVVYNIPTTLADSIDIELNAINTTLVLLKRRLDGITFGLGPTGYYPTYSFGPTGTMGPWGP